MCGKHCDDSSNPPADAACRGLCITGRLTTKAHMGTGSKAWKPMCAGAEVYLMLAQGCQACIAVETAKLYADPDPDSAYWS